MLLNGSSNGSDSNLPPPAPYPHLVLYSILRTFHLGSFNFSERIRKQNIFLNYKKLLLSGRLLFKNCQNRCTQIFCYCTSILHVRHWTIFFPLQQKRCWLRNTSRTAAQLHEVYCWQLEKCFLKKKKHYIVFSYFPLQHCFICRPSDFTVTEDAEI